VAEAAGQWGTALNTEPPLLKGMDPELEGGVIQWGCFYGGFHGFNGGESTICLDA